MLGNWNNLVSMMLNNILIFLADYGINT